MRGIYFPDEYQGQHLNRMLLDLTPHSVCNFQLFSTIIIGTDLQDWLDGLVEWLCFMLSLLSALPLV